MTAPLIAPDVAARRYAHGTNARYVFARCRCSPCTEANRQWFAEREEDRVAAAPWAVDTRGRVSAEGFKKLRVRNRITGEVESSYTIDVEDASSCRYIPAIAKRRARFLNKRDGDVVAASRDYVSADLARRQLERLQRAGMGYKIVAKRAGLTPSVLGRIMWPAGRRPIKRVKRETLDALLAVSTDMLVDGADGTRVDAARSQRLLREMIAAGFGKSFLSSLILGRDAATLQLLDGATITVRNARRIALVHAKLRGRKPTCTDTPHGLRMCIRPPKARGRLSAGEIRALELPPLKPWRRGRPARASGVAA